MACAICQIRRPRRFCPGVHGEICAVCCGTEREVTVNCPLDCPHLKEARKHDRPVALAEEELPNREIRISEQFLEEHEELLSAVGQALVNAGLTVPGAVDPDIREALAALIRTQRTLASGLYYESLPENTVAARIFRALQSGIATFQREEKERAGLARTRDADVLAILVFVERLGLDRNNGRPRGRAFLDFLRELYPSPLAGGAGETGFSSSLLLG
jgi:hypothetical protein